MTVLDCRGTHGSGKSYLAHSLLKMGNTPITGEAYGKQDQHLGYFIPRLQCALLGKYATGCGGCDGIKTPEEVVRRVKLFSSRYKFVMLEGILVSHTFQRYNDLANELQDYRFLFLDTPLETCISRVVARRKAKGNDKPLDPKNITKDWHCIWGKVRQKMIDAGQIVKVLPHKTSLETLLKEFRTNAKTPQTV